MMALQSAGTPEKSADIASVVGAPIMKSVPRPACTGPTAAARRMASTSSPTSRAASTRSESVGPSRVGRCGDVSALEARRRKNARNVSSREGVATTSGKPTVASKHSSASAILSTFRKPLVVSDKSIPVVDVTQTSDSFDKPVASKSVTENAAAGRSISSSASWLPRGVLLAHLKEHRGAVNHLATAPTNSNVPFFVSCSDDGSCKIWDSRRLDTYN